MSATSTRPTGQMLMYSGRPDPKWIMKEDDWDKLNKLIESLPECGEYQGRFNQPSILGYRGFVCDWKDEKIYYLAQKKQVAKVKKDSYTTYDDPSKSVELWLLDNAKTHGSVDYQPTSEQ